MNKQHTPVYESITSARLFLTTLMAVLAVFTWIHSARATTFTIIHTFKTSPGTSPRGFPTLIQGSDGNFYGTTAVGGDNGDGTIYKLTPDGAVEILHHFDGSDGFLPLGGLVEGTDGNFYGTTRAGGNQAGAPGDGTIFKITPSGGFERLHSFDFFQDGGNHPATRLTEGADGNFYGTTSGSVFKISPSGDDFTVLKELSGPTGTGPTGELVRAADGTLFGTTGSNGSHFNGTVYKITPAGDFSVVFDFPSFQEQGSSPAGLVIGQDGNLYGTCSSGGQFGGGGTIFKLTPSGPSFTTLHSFGKEGFSDNSEGLDPRESVIQGSDGHLYGTTVSGGRGAGIIFRLTAEGVFTVLHTFPNAANSGEGYSPGQLLQAKDGSFYGATQTTANDVGCAFRLVLTPEPAQLLNISTRLRVQTDENVLIGGFIVRGNALKKTIIRGLGPSLSAAGVPDALADPHLIMYRNSSGGVFAENNDWKDGSTKQAEIEATGIPPSKNLEAAVVRKLEPDAYTTILEGSDGGTGIGLIEAYDLLSNVDSELANISTRGLVETGDNVMIGGFIVGPPGRPARRVLLRAIGPSLTGAGVSNPLQDPTIALHDSNGAVLALNDDWRSDQEQEIKDSTIPPSDERESAIVRTLEPGAYTAIVRGKNNTSGVALVEAYALQ